MADNDAGGSIEGISSLLVHNVVSRLQRPTHKPGNSELMVGPAKVNWLKVADGGFRSEEEKPC